MFYILYESFLILYSFFFSPTMTPTRTNDERINIRRHKKFKGIPRINDNIILLLTWSTFYKWVVDKPLFVTLSVIPMFLLVVSLTKPYPFRGVFSLSINRYWSSYSSTSVSTLTSSFKVRLLCRLFICSLGFPLIFIRLLGYVNRSSSTPPLFIFYFDLFTMFIFCLTLIELTVDFFKFKGFWTTTYLINCN